MQDLILFAKSLCIPNLSLIAKGGNIPKKPLEDLLLEGRMGLWHSNYKTVSSNSVHETEGCGNGEPALLVLFKSITEPAWNHVRLVDSAMKVC